MDEEVLSPPKPNMSSAPEPTNRGSTDGSSPLTAAFHSVEPAEPVPPALIPPLPDPKPALKLGAAVSVVEVDALVDEVLEVVDVRSDDALPAPRTPPTVLPGATRGSSPPKGYPARGSSPTKGTPGAGLFASEA